MSLPASTLISPEEYLERERKAETRSEYFRGRMFAMAGTSLNHAQIVANLTRELGNQFRNRRCRAVSSELRVGVSPAGLYTYPDVVVTCGEEKFLDAELDTLLNPTVLIEVLSDSTKNYDRGQKF